MKALTARVQDLREVPKGIHGELHVLDSTKRLSGSLLMSFWDLGLQEIGFRVSGFGVSG